MTKAKITDAKGFDCAPQGHTVINIPQGTIVTGDVAEWALAAKKAQRMLPAEDRETKVVDVPEKKKAGRPRKADK